ncbi:MAG TPA: hypothetical protein VK070_13695 [Acidimicrobiia bacterium]|nr:hypothetical protein [Acidimicrobiia bacterium]
MKRGFVDDRTGQQVLLLEQDRVLPRRGECGGGDRDEVVPEQASGQSQHHDRRRDVRRYDTGESEIVVELHRNPHQTALYQRRGLWFD